MQIELEKTPKNPTIIGGFPGVGLVGTIAAGFLIEHLNAKSIGRMNSKKIQPVIAIHQGKVVEPLEIYYDKKNNIIIINALSNIKDVEWDLSEAIVDLAKKVGAKEIINLEGIASNNPLTTPQTYYYTSNLKRTKQLEKSEKIKQLKEGVAIGVTAALMLNAKKLPCTSIFVETHSNMPDSRAAAKLIETLDQMLGLKVDYKPLIKKAEEFEKKLKLILQQSKTVINKKQQKELDYFG